MTNNTYFKKLIFVFTFAGIFMQTISPAYAIDLNVPGLIHNVNNYLNQASKSAAQQQRKLSDIIKRADNLINNRNTSLTTLLTRIQNDSRLTTDQKTSLSSDIKTAINGLSALKTKIDSDTNVQTALDDAKQIFTNFRIYEEFEPKTRILIILNNLQSSIIKVQALIPQLQNLINTLSSQGKDVSQLTPLLNDISAQLQSISSTLSSDISTIQAVTPSITNPQAVFSNTRGDIQNIVRTSFQKIRQDVEQMKVIFRQIILSNTTTPASTSGTLTPGTAGSSILTPTTTASPSGK